jgi:hypothetical protein
MNRYICYAEERSSNIYHDGSMTFQLEARNLREAIALARRLCRHTDLKYIETRRVSA